MRNKFVAGNWKMNTIPNEGVRLANSISNYFCNLDLDKDVKIVIGVPFTHIDACVKNVDVQKVNVAAQNCSQFDSGAYTGEVSASMIKDLGAKYVIIGHSERRQIFGETDQVIADKAFKCYENQLMPILCCGETLEQRECGNHFSVVKDQLENSLQKTDEHNILKTVIAYEPIWAIGTGKTASPEQAQEMHVFIRKTLSDIYSKEIASKISILYGGSVKPENASILFSQDDIDGGLIGGASLKEDDFIEIFKAI